MTYAEAITRLNDMAVKNEYSETEATEAIVRILQAPTCNAMPKDALLAAIRYLLRCLQNVSNCHCEQSKWHVFHYRDVNEDEQKEHPDWDFVIDVDCVPNHGERILYYQAWSGDIYEDEWDDDKWAETGDTVKTDIQDGDAWMEMPEGPER